MDEFNFSFHEMPNSAERTYVVNQSGGHATPVNVGVLTYDDLSGSWTLIHAVAGVAELEWIDESDAPTRPILFTKTREILNKRLR